MLHSWDTWVPAPFRDFTPGHALTPHHTHTTLYHTQHTHHNKCHTTPNHTTYHTYHTIPHHTHTFVSGLQNLGLVPAQLHLGSERSQFYDVFDPEYLLADPGQYHQLFLGSPNLHLLFYSSDNVGSEDRSLGRKKGRCGHCGAEMSLEGLED